jgi:hypothetical protein
MSISLAPQLTQRDSQWAAWKAAHSAKKGLHQYEDDGGVYTIWFYDGPEVHTCKIWKGSVPDGVLSSYSQSQNDTDKADFEGGLKTTANKTIVSQAEGRQILAPTFEDAFGLTPIWRGYLYTASPLATSIFDELITSERRLRGGWYELLVTGQAVLGDYVEFSIVDKDDMLGLFATYGLTVGVDVLELKKYVRKDYVNPGIFGQRQEFMVGGVFQVMAGLYFRTIYKSLGAVPVQFKTVVLAYE